MKDFDFFQHAAGKDKLHRAIDALPEGACAILVSDTCMHDFDDPDDKHEPSECEWKVGEILDYRFIGNLTVLRGVGLVSYLAHVINRNGEEQYEDDDA